MSLINPALLFGLGLAVIPVILHFLLRSKPKKLLFPALRLIQVRRRQNVRRMRLRHIWLLLLRIAVIALIVLAMARPRLPAANYAFNVRETLTLVVIVIVALVLYWGILGIWRRKRLTNHVLNSRRSALRGGMGIVALLLFLLFVAWPYQKRIAAEITGPKPETAQNIPISAVMLFDTSLSMQYRTESKTRLETAKAMAVKHLNNLPPQSRIAITETATDSPILFQADLSGARARIDSLETKAVSHPLNKKLRTAVELHEEDRRRVLDQSGIVADDTQQDNYIREIYIFTDLAQSGWNIGSSTFLRDELARLPWVSVYLIDVGVEDPIDVSISSLKLSRQTLPVGAPLILDVTIQPTGIKEAERTVELYVQNDEGKLVKHGQHTVSLDERTGARVQFSVSGLTGPVSQGEVRLISSDPLPANDVQYFTVEVRPPPRILLVAPTEDHAIYLREALSPTELVQQNRSRYLCEYVSPEELDTTILPEFAVVCLISVEQLSNETWKQLDTYVSAGGGLAIFLGTSQASDETPITPLSYNSDAAQAFLPAELTAHLKFVPPEYLDLRDLSHPILKRFDDLGGAGELNSVEVHRYWKADPLEKSSVIASFSNSSAAPAIVEKSHGTGRTLLLTTSVDMQGWSDIPLARWSFLAFVDQMMQYLSRRSEAILNYNAGEEVVVRIDAAQPVTRYLLRKPQLQQLPGEVQPNAKHFTVLDADQLGHYEVIGGDPDSTFSTGFSMNLSNVESDFTRLSADELDNLLGEKQYSVARNMNELDRLVNYGRIGVEVFPMVLLFVIVVFCAEHVVANRFYQADQAVEHE